jgi:Ca2+-binding RTX toxin-like protein
MNDVLYRDVEEPSGLDLTEGGADRLYGDAGRHFIAGNLGADLLDGGTGSDTLIGGNFDEMRDDTIRGGAGIDFMSLDIR